MNAILSTPAVRLAQVRALIAACAIQTPSAIAEAFDGIRDDLDELPGVYAVTSDLLDCYAATDRLSDMEHEAMCDCGDEPVLIPGWGGGYDYDAYTPRSVEAHERWCEEVARAVDAAGHEFRAAVASMLRDVSDVLACGQGAPVLATTP